MAFRMRLVNWMSAPTRATLAWSTGFNNLALSIKTILLCQSRGDFALTNFQSGDPLGAVGAEKNSEYIEE